MLTFSEVPSDIPDQAGLKIKTWCELNVYWLNGRAENYKV